jgi:hypothetical protein
MKEVDGHFLLILLLLILVKVVVPVVRLFILLMNIIETQEKKIVWEKALINLGVDS